MRRRVKALVAPVAFAAFLLAASPAQATFHLIKIREVSVGVSGPNRSDAYVELQSYSAGQSLLSGHTLTIYHATATTPPPTPCTFDSNMANSQNQATALVGGFSAPVTPDFLCGDVNDIDPSAGAACWATDQIAPVDCVSWGTFSGSLGSPTGTPAPAIPDGMALQRTIAPGCPTLLEGADDSNNSATDFSVTAPNPRNNASPITEKSCGGGGGGGGVGGNDKTPPQTKIRKVSVSGTTATVKFSGTDTGRIARAGGLSFKCKLDRKGFKKCTSPKKFRHLSSGKHKVQVEAIDAAGNVDPTPAKKKFTV